VVKLREAIRHGSSNLLIVEAPLVAAAAAVVVVVVVVVVVLGRPTGPNLFHVHSSSKHLLLRLV